MRSKMKSETKTKKQRIENEIWDPITFVVSQLTYNLEVSVGLNVSHS
jgi:hypothetical protein